MGADSQELCPTGLEHSARPRRWEGLQLTLGLVDIVKGPTPITSCSSWRMTKRAGAPGGEEASRGGVLLRQTSELGCPRTWGQPPLDDRRCAVMSSVKEEEAVTLDNLAVLGCPCHLRLLGYQRRLGLLLFIFLFSV